MADYGLILPFLTDDPVFAHGVEVGMLYQRMQATQKAGGYVSWLEDEINELFLMDNQEQILLMASRLGWSVESTEGIETPGWCRIHMRRT